MGADVKFNHLRGTVFTVATEVVDGVEKEIRRAVTLVFGDLIPENLAPGQLQKLHQIGALGDGSDPVALRAEGDDDSAALHAAAASTSEPQAADLSKLGDATGEELAGLYKQPSPPTVKALLEAVGADADLAKRVLTAETEALKGDVRTSLVKGLEKVIAAASTSEPQA